MTHRRHLPPGMWYADKPDVCKPKDIANERFGEVVALRPGCMPYWWVQCDYGHEMLRDARQMRQVKRNGKTTVCTHPDCVARRKAERGAA